MVLSRLRATNIALFIVVVGLLLFLNGQISFATHTPETTPTATPTPTAIPSTTKRINVGGPDYVDTGGNVWFADRPLDAAVGWGYIDPGYHVATDRRASNSSLTISGTEDDELYFSSRNSVDRYDFLLQDGQYSVRLLFAETSGFVSGQNQRVFDVNIEGVTVLDDFDIFAASGAFATATVQSLGPFIVDDGVLTIEFLDRFGRVVVDYPFNASPEISAIEVTSGLPVGAPTPTPGPTATPSPPTPTPPQLAGTARPMPTREPTPTPTPKPAWLLLSADANGDGLIDSGDLQLLTAAFDTSPGEPGFDARVDFNTDGAIDILDLVVMGAQYAD